MNSEAFKNRTQNRTLQSHMNCVLAPARPTGSRTGPHGRRSSHQWNCSSSVEPVSAFTLDEPPWMTVVTSSK